MNSLTPLALQLTQMIGKKDLEFGCIVMGCIHDIGYDEAGGNGGGYGGVDIYRRMVYVDKNYSIPLDKDLFELIIIDEEGNSELIDSGYYDGIEDEGWNFCLEYEKNIEIIGHPVQIEDLFRFGEEHGTTYDIINFGSRCGFTSLIPSNENFNIPYNPTLPLYLQSDETLTSIINIIKGL